ncbi:sulfate ABC transporter substrate-binding protein [Avibacterium sp. 21-595]|uniref:sulfate ABC transporter substrate-binding protein n=1 Tax=Avibacterium sp. 21-595 TaxID=2911527 RepID=UPI002025F59D|nr:sulfate ABC transporter substrate-binding protein [Avibacterium sp. 21-595]URL06085.1 sulfate ABC transporter substrate-binding protein [Avibacterium sp. 21-595]
MKKGVVLLAGIFVIVLGLLNCSRQTEKKVLLNVAYDVIRDFYHDYNQAFRQQHANIVISQSHGSASKQTLSVAKGLPADIVTLTQANDIDLLVQKGLVASDWAQRFPNNATPFGSVMVFLVKKGNPKQIRDWQDLTRNDVRVVFANPKTSANGRFAYLAAYSYAKQAFSGEAQQLDFIRRLLRNVPVLEAGARSATMVFTQRHFGDVLITPENEAALAAQRLDTQGFSVIYPSLTLYTPVLVAETTNTKINGTHKLAQTYLQGLWSEQGQELAAQHHFRPSNAKIAQKFTALFPKVNALDVNEQFGDWATINQQHFADNALFDQLYFQACVHCNSQAD